MQNSPETHHSKSAACAPRAKVSIPASAQPPCRGDGKCCYMEPCNVSGTFHTHTCLNLCPFHGELSPDSQDTAAAQAPQSALPPETSSAPSWKSENHFIFMHSQHVLQPSPLFETKSSSPPWDQPDRSITGSWRSPANLHSSCILCYLHPSPTPTQQTRS